MQERDCDTEAGRHVQEREGLLARPLLLAPAKPLAEPAGLRTTLAEPDLCLFLALLAAPRPFSCLFLAVAISRKAC